MATSKIRVGALEIKPRDLALLRGLFECRVMTNEHATALYFEGKSPAEIKRLQKLKAAGLVSERPRRAFEPSILFLTRKGLVLLQKEGVLNDYPSFELPQLERRARVSDLTIRHELEVMDVKTAFHAAIKSEANFEIKVFNTWPLLNEFEAYRPGDNSEKVLVKPDGFISIQDKDAVTEGFAYEFFLELDRSQEIQEILVGKAGCYFEYYKSGDFAVRNGASSDDYKKFPFRVLMVLKTAKRRNNTAERLLQANLPVSKQFCLSTFEEVIRDPFGAIWVNPTDYHEATKGTLFDPDRQSLTNDYRQQPEREVLVESKVKKIRLLES
ncbi:MAG: replication-relaxation family protein [Verrucomicrobiota bacterium]